MPITLNEYKLYLIASLFMFYIYVIASPAVIVLNPTSLKLATYLSLSVFFHHVIVFAAFVSPMFGLIYINL